MPNTIETPTEKMDGKIMMAATHELIGTMTEISEKTKNHRQHAAAFILAAAALALRHTVRHPQAPEVYDDMMDRIKQALENLEDEK